ncbi:MAG: energy transducer TonB, partial [Planctomycetota bacterium]
PDPDPEPFPITSINDLTTVTLSQPSRSRRDDHVDFFDELPRATRQVVPEYPALAREAGIEGVVHIEVVVGADGKVEGARVVRSDVTSAMEQAAVAAARQCRFEPARQAGRPVRARVVIPFQFRLH